MGYRLYREVIEHGPPDITSGEMVVWLVIADNANDDTRFGWLERDELLRRTRMGARGIAHAFSRLATRGYELRVERGKDKKGRPVYAYKGAQSTYRLPVLDLRRVTQESPTDEQRVTHKSERVTHKSAKDDPQVTPSPQSPQSTQQQRASDDEKAEVLAEIRRRKPEATAALIQHVYREDGAAILAEIREKAGRQRITDWIDGLAALPPCTHGFAGGNELRPDTGKPQCALCRAQHRRTAA